MFSKPGPNILILFVIGFLVNPHQAHAGCPKIVSLTPQVAENLWDLGKGSCLVATSPFSDYPEEVKLIPRIGSGMFVGIERILLHQPDWVISNRGALSADLSEALKAGGIRSLTMQIDSVASFFSENLRLLDEVFSEKTHPKLERFRACHTTRKSNVGHFRFLIFVSVDPFILFGHDTFLSDLMTSSGGTNALPTLKISYPQVSQEWLIATPITHAFFLFDTDREKTETLAKLKELWPSDLKIMGLSRADFSRASLRALNRLKNVFPNFSYDCFH